MTSKIVLKMIEELKKAGLPATIVRVKLTSEQQKREEQIERDVRKYVMEIEEAHKRAANSTLRFKTQIRGTEPTSVPLYRVH